MLETSAQVELLAIARGALIACTRDNSFELPALSHSYPSDCGAFVTLHGPQNELRGCIGCMSASYALPSVVSDMAKSAALKDPRFDPVRSDELDSLTIEISVLSAQEKIASLEEIEIGRDGLVVVSGHKRGVLLPQVASERGWDAKTFVEQTCIKANLFPEDYLKDDVDVYRFSAQVFSE